jgi:hypothetical protein
LFTYDSEGDIIEQWYDASGSRSSSVNKWRVASFHGVLPPEGFSLAAMRKRKLRFNVHTKDEQSGMTGPQLKFNAFDQDGKDAWLLDSDETIEKGEDDTAADDEIEEGGGGDGAGKSSAGTANEEAANAAPVPASEPEPDPDSRSKDIY